MQQGLIHGDVFDDDYVENKTCNDPCWNYDNRTMKLLPVFLLLVLVILSGCLAPLPPSNFHALVVGEKQGQVKYDTDVFETEGDSMLPTLPKTAKVQIEYLPFAQIKRGMIISYWNESINAYVLHRAVYHAGLPNEGWICKGDHNLREDGCLVTKQNYIGRFVQIVSVDP